MSHLTVCIWDKTADKLYDNALAATVVTWLGSYIQVAKTGLELRDYLFFSKPVYCADSMSNDFCLTGGHKDSLWSQLSLA